MKKIKNLLAALYAVVCMTAILTIGVSASYIDPSVTTQIVQIVAAAAIAVGAVAAIVWRKIKRGVSKAIGRTEDAKTEMEEDIVELSEEANEKEEKVEEKTK